MRASFTQSFKIQAVKKALRRPAGVTLSDIAAALGIGHWALGSQHSANGSLRLSTKGSNPCPTQGP
jgi:transposase-like protein